MDFRRMFEDGTIVQLTNPRTNSTYYLLSLLGVGVNGSVFLVVDPDTNTEYATKLMYLKDDDHLLSFTEEVNAYLYLSMVPHCRSTIVCLVDSFIVRVGDAKVGVLVTEVMDGDLESLPPADYELVPIFKSLLEGLAYIHSRSIAHRDIKPGNILRKGRAVKLGDLGLICAGGYDDITSCTSIGTPQYLSPVAHKYWGDPAPLSFSQAEDVWALAMSMMSLAFGRRSKLPPSGMHELASLNQTTIQRGLDESPFGELRLTNLTPEQFKFLLEKMLVINTAQRWSVKRVLGQLNNFILENQAANLEAPFAYFDPTR